ncbi:MAG TPA: phosphatase PAP2 family protein [Anaeromyxobacteraceae bacterium]|nr:phosphatase PAP2 family protein [Anaeromyxobacteraceae bacterium]
MSLHGPRVIALAIAAALATAPAAFADEVVTPPGDQGPFLGPQYEYGQMNVVKRALYDVVAIPANVGSWDAADWAQLGAFGGAIAGLWYWPANPSPDVRFERWTTVHVSPHIPTIWNEVMQPLLWTSIAGGTLGTWYWAATHDRPDIAQGMSLMGEALAVTQAYHVTLKFFIGREGPQDGSLEGRVLGPGKALKYYPAGTPSGHAGTLYSLLSVGFAYFEPPTWVQVVGHATVGGLVFAHVLDHRHYLSESLWGSAMGWYVGQWVVKHRTTRSIRERPGTLTADLVPLPIAGGAGLGLVGRF